MIRDRRRDFLLLLGGVVLGILGNILVEFLMRLYDIINPEINVNVIYYSLLLLVFGTSLEVFVIYKMLE